jgi:hypothetical protein
MPIGRLEDYIAVPLDLDESALSIEILRIVFLEP